MKAIRKIRDLALSTTIFGGVLYGYLYYKTNKNLKEHLETMELSKDNTRPQNQSFGIGWGYRADDIVMNQIDSGDLILLKFQCGETLSVGQLMRCFKNTALKLEMEYHGLGVAFRNEDGLKILLNEFDTTYLLEYPELVAKPFINELSIRKIKDLSPTLQTTLGKIVTSTGNKLINETPQQMFNKVFSQLGLLNSNLLNINDLDRDPPLKNEYESKIFVRTTTARNMRI